MRRRWVPRNLRRPGIDRPDPGKARTVREMFREDPGLWYDVAQAVLILSVAVAAVIGAVNCCS